MMSCPPCHLEVPVYDGGLAVVQPGHSLTGVTEDAEYLGLREPSTQSLIHQLQHIDLHIVKLLLWSSESLISYPVLLLSIYSGLN